MEANAMHQTAAEKNGGLKSSGHKCLLKAAYYP
jgi:hypothetical protein